MKNPEGRKLTKGSCSRCGRTIYKRSIHFKLHKRNYCSTECQSEDSRKGKSLSCSECGALVYRSPSQLKQSKSGNVFCSRTCATKFHNKNLKIGAKHPNYTNGLGSYRGRALKKYGEQCYLCGYDTYKEVLEVHHIDKDRNNNKLDNLVVLCSNCHKEEHIRQVVKEM